MGISKSTKVLQACLKKKSPKIKLVGEKMHRFERTIGDHNELFAMDENELRFTDVYVHKIILKEGAVPIKRKAYATSPKERDIIKAQVDKYLAQGVISPSSSAW